MKKKAYIEPKAMVVSMEGVSIIAASAGLKRGKPSAIPDEEPNSDPYGRIWAE